MEHSVTKLATASHMVRQATTGSARFGALLLLVMSATTSAAEQILEEVVVTAQRRDQSLQSVPISVTALTSGDIQELNLADSVSIGDRVPNLDFKTIGGTLNITIRGVGNNDFNTAAISPVSVYRDGVVVGANAPQVFSLFDMDRSRSCADRKAPFLARTPQEALSPTTRRNPATRWMGGCGPPTGGLILCTLKPLPPCRSAKTSSCE